MYIASIGFEAGSCHKQMGRLRSIQGLPPTMPYGMTRTPHGIDFSSVCSYHHNEQMQHHWALCPCLYLQCSVLLQQHLLRKHALDLRKPSKFVIAGVSTVSARHSAGSQLWPYLLLFAAVPISAHCTDHSQHAATLLHISGFGHDAGTQFLYAGRGMQSPVSYGDMSIDKMNVSLT